MSQAWTGSSIIGSAAIGSKTFLFGNPHTFKANHAFNGFGFAAEGNATYQVFDITEASITKGGEVHLSRADNDVYPRNGGFADAIFGVRISSKNVSAFNTYTKGDELLDIQFQYEGRAQARAYTMGLFLHGGIVDEDVSVSGQHGAEPGTVSLNVQATIPVSSGGLGIGAGFGPYSIPWTINVVADDTRDDTWTPTTTFIP